MFARTRRLRCHRPTTFVVVLELIAGSVWTLLQIEWTRVQLSHLGYPDYLAYSSGAWHLTLPAVEAAMHERAVELGWIAR